MRWVLDSEQLMLQEAISGWLGRAAAPTKVRDMFDGDPSDFEALLAEEGWLAIGTAEDRGGQGGGLLELALVAEQLARFAAPSSAWLGTVLALPALDADAAAEFLEAGRRAALVVSSDRPIAPTGIVVSGDGLTGEVAMVLGADRADLLIVPTAEGLYALDASTAGVTISPVDLLDRSRTIARVRLDGAPATRLDADPSEVLAAAALRAAVLISADALGAATRMRELAVAYSLQRTQFGQPIGSFQAVKHAAATMLVDEEAGRSVVYYAAESVEEGLPESAQHAAVAKAQVTRAAADAAESSLTLHGAIGYTWEHDLQLFYKRAKLDLELFGAPRAWNDRIADALELIPASARV